MGADVLLAAGGVWADAPVLNIQSPTGTEFTTTFPYTQSITFTLSHTYLENVKVLDVQVDGTTIVNNGEPIGSPFTNTNQCSPTLLANASACNAIDPSNATITIPWTRQRRRQPHNHGLGETPERLGEDEETVQVAMLNTEYPAHARRHERPYQQRFHLENASGKETWLRDLENRRQARERESLWTAGQTL